MASSSRQRKSAPHPEELRGMKKNKNTAKEEVELNSQEPQLGLVELQSHYQQLIVEARASAIPPFNFLALPAELRNRIYALVAGDWRPMVFRETSGRIDEDSLPLVEPFPTGLMRSYLMYYYITLREKFVRHITICMELPPFFGPTWGYLIDWTFIQDMEALECLSVQFSYYRSLHEMGVLESFKAKQSNSHLLLGTIIQLLRSTPRHIKIDLDIVGKPLEFPMRGKRTIRPSDKVPARAKREQYAPRSGNCNDKGDGIWYLPVEEQEFQEKHVLLLQERDYRDRYGLQFVLDTKGLQKLFKEYAFLQGKDVDEVEEDD
ncbi:hypothetical protein EJ08DRAFT_733852 [Tothia fuscella]|uniref:Uncharacterized protein n=1 Tax=Tothia fuscella TaxID=1048955 RepID=A0A9P4TYZ3_9PEZI|nr:hypothetical protein EJ08DRAFT_733852 [Tothia fuscella]